MVREWSDDRVLSRLVLERVLALEGKAHVRLRVLSVLLDAFPLTETDVARLLQLVRTTVTSDPSCLQAACSVLCVVLRGAGESVSLLEFTRGVVSALQRHPQDEVNLHLLRTYMMRANREGVSPVESSIPLNCLPFFLSLFSSFTTMEDIRPLLFLTPVYLTHGYASLPKVFTGIQNRIAASLHSQTEKELSDATLSLLLQHLRVVHFTLVWNRRRVQVDVESVAQRLVASASKSPLALRCALVLLRILPLVSAPLSAQWDVLQFCFSFLAPLCDYDSVELPSQYGLDAHEDVDHACFLSVAPPLRADV